MPGEVGRQRIAVRRGEHVGPHAARRGEIDGVRELDREPAQMRGVARRLSRDLAEWGVQGRERLTAFEVPLKGISAVCDLDDGLPDPTGEGPAGATG